jgi:hypothetical protein
MGTARRLSVSVSSLVRALSQSAVPQVRSVLNAWPYRITAAYRLGRLVEAPTECASRRGKAVVALGLQFQPVLPPTALPAIGAVAHSRLVPPRSEP